MFLDAQDLSASKRYRATSGEVSMCRYSMRYDYGDQEKYSTKELQEFIARRTGDGDRNKCRLTCVRKVSKLPSQLPGRTFE